MGQKSFNVYPSVDYVHKIDVLMADIGQQLLPNCDCACNLIPPESRPDFEIEDYAKPRELDGATMDGEAKGPTKGWVPLKISHQDGFTVLRTVTASPNFLRKAKEAT